MREGGTGQKWRKEGKNDREACRSPNSATSYVISKFAVLERGKLSRLLWLGGRSASANPGGGFGISLGSRRIQEQVGSQVHETLRARMSPGMRVRATGIKSLCRACHAITEGPRAAPTSLAARRGRSPALAEWR